MSKSQQIEKLEAELKDSRAEAESLRQLVNDNAVAMIAIENAATTGVAKNGVGDSFALFAVQRLIERVKEQAALDSEEFDGLDERIDELEDENREWQDDVESANTKVQLLKAAVERRHLAIKLVTGLFGLPTPPTSTEMTLAMFALANSDLD